MDHQNISHAFSARGAVARWMQVALLLFFYTVSFIDRSILSMLVVPIQKDLRISDFQMSLLLGPAFAIFYVICGLPMGQIVDRYSRRLVVFGGVAIWAVATALCGLANNYALLFLFRMGVGVGEATLTPAAHAAIADDFPAPMLSRAMSVFTIGSAIGAGLAVVIGGVVVQVTKSSFILDIPVLGPIHAWQTVLLVIGFFTLICSPMAMMISVRRPNAGDHSMALTDRAEGFGQLMRRGWALFVLGPIGFAFINAINNAYSAWVPTFMMRTYGWNAAQVGVAWGTQHSVAGTVGFLLTAYLVDRWYSGGRKDAHTLFPIISLAISAPLAIAGFLVRDPWLFLALNTPFFLLSYGWMGYAAASLQMFAPPHLRGRVSALLLVVATLVGMGLGAPLTGWMTDAVFQDKSMVGLSLATATLIFTPCSIGFLMMARRQMMRLGKEK